MTATAKRVAGDLTLQDRNERLTRAFFKAWEQADEEAIVDFFADDAIYHNMPYKPVEGIANIRKAVAGFLKTGEDMTFDLIKLVVAGDSVVTERVDGWTHKGKRKSLPVLGMLEFNDAGKLTGWREYFDVKTFEGG
ncbi:MAG TPA: limonene-1,2-epoxide hydrolase [Porticoccaceae bacterium]|nr:limonene-1,2-epoxide hydrolase [Porticoccaceae bacterium]